MTLEDLKKEFALWPGMCVHVSTVIEMLEAAAKDYADMRRFQQEYITAEDKAAALEKERDEARGKAVLCEVEQHESRIRLGTADNERLKERVREEGAKVSALEATLARVRELATEADAALFPKAEGEAEKARAVCTGTLVHDQYTICPVHDHKEPK